jgi:hypothetical protein
MYQMTDEAGGDDRCCACRPATRVGSHQDIDDVPAFELRRQALLRALQDLEPGKYVKAADG